VSVEINIPQFLQHLVDGVRVANVNGRTVGDCLNDLVTQMPQLKKLLFTRSGKLRKHLDVYINGESAYPEELAKPVLDGDKLHIVNAIVGG
jgi:molybdopterin converting factor small subunit